ncbi:hypothetical protein VCHA35O141_50137 [Vibrio chagasii]|nr:hypothetical protein VCHA36P166_20388 [Vibrio chagasii]CAH7031611.1 hypothetical protein VCHA35O141_50137 [Vibrio chagasii]CAH7053356.1 hypothetical protein VCHA35O143_60099 [Vibrio chagasii]CDT17334.1 hypothetical protein VCRLGP8_1430080 [Vibrio crassostreae]
MFMSGVYPRNLELISVSIAAEYIGKLLRQQEIPNNQTLF